MDRTAEIENVASRGRGRPRRENMTRETRNDFVDEADRLVETYDEVTPIFVESVTSAFPAIEAPEGFVIRWLRVRDKDTPVSVAEYTGAPYFMTPLLASEAKGFEAWVANYPDVADGEVIRYRDCVAFKLSAAIADGIKKGEHIKATSQLASIHSEAFIANRVQDPRLRGRIAASLRRDGVFRPN